MISCSFSSFTDAWVSVTNEQEKRVCNIFFRTNGIASFVMKGFIDSKKKKRKGKREIRQKKKRNDEKRFR